MSSPRKTRRNRHPIILRRAGIYARVSQIAPGMDPQESTSVADQDADCQEACHDRGWQIASEYADPGISASQFSRVRDRPGWAALIGDIESGALNVVVLWESSRGDRKPREWMDFLYRCLEKDVWIHIVNHDLDRLGVTYDMSRPVDLDKLSREGLDNAKASVETSQRIKRHKSRQRGRGNPDGRIPYGYMRRYDPNSGSLIEQVPDPEKAPIVRELFERTAARESQRSIIARLLERGVAKPGGGMRWTGQTIMQVVRRPAYAGLIIWDGEEHKAQWMPLVDVELWRSVQHILDARRVTGSRPSRVVHLMSRIAECSVCGSPMAAIPKGGTRGLYACPDGHAACVLPDLDVFGLAITAAYWSKKDRVDALLAPPENSAATTAAAEVDRLNADLDELDRAAEQGMRAQLVMTLEKRLREELRDAEARCELMVVDPALRELTAGPIEETAARLADMKLAARRSVIRQTARFVVHPVGRGRRVPIADRVDVLPIADR